MEGDWGGGGLINEEEDWLGFTRPSRFGESKPVIQAAPVTSAMKFCSLCTYHTWVRGRFITRE